MKTKTKLQTDTPALSSEQCETLQEKLNSIKKEIAAIKKLGVIINEPDYNYAKRVLQTHMAKPAPKRIAPTDVKSFMQWFIQSPVEDLYDVKRGQWECIRGAESAGRCHALVFHSKCLDKAGKDKRSGRHIVVLRGSTGESVPIFNASSIKYGTSYWRAQKDPQVWAEMYGAVPLPFETVMGDVQLDLFQAKVLDWGGAERFNIPPVGTRSSEAFNIINRHFAGAVLVQIEDSYFLFDCDREEVKYHNFNPFFTRLPGKAETIKEAYELLMPAAVKQAVADGVETIRQGEFFFVRAMPGYVESCMRALGEHGSAYDDVAIPHLMHLADIHGAQCYNLELLRLQYQMRHWRRKYQHELDAGNLPMDAPETIIKPSSAIAAALAWTKVEVGPAASRITPELRAEMEQSFKRYQYTRAYGAWLDHDVHEELRIRLAPNGMDKSYQVRFDQSLVAEQDSRRSTNGHQMTLTFIDPSNNATYGRGVVLHNGREHRPVYLDGWYRVYCNTATANYTVHGDVD